MKQAFKRATTTIFTTQSSSQPSVNQCSERPVTVRVGAHTASRRPCCQQVIKVLTSWLSLAAVAHGEAFASTWWPCCSPGSISRHALWYVRDSWGGGARRV